MKQARLEALRMAVGFTKEPYEAMMIAEEFTQFIEEGPKVVEIGSQKDEKDDKAKTKKRKTLTL